MGYAKALSDNMELRNRFSVLHRDKLSDRCYATIGDIELIEMRPTPGFVVAKINFRVWEKILPKMVQAVLWRNSIEAPVPYYVPVFFVVGRMFDTMLSPSQHRFDVYKLDKVEWTEYKYGERQTIRYTETQVCNDINWDDLWTWELQMRYDRDQVMRKYRPDAK